MIMLLHLPSHLKTSDVFNAKHLTPYFVNADRDDLNSRVNSFQLGEIDAGKDRL
jgi:hypothetical protein